MAINQESFNNNLFDLLKTRGYNPVPIDAKGQNTPVPQDADVFKFDFKKGMDDNKNYGPVWASIDNASNLIIYYDDNIADSDDTNTSGTEFSDSWPSLLKVLKKWAMRRQLGFELKNRNHLGSDMAQREYVRKKEELGESYHPINRKTSYNDSIPTVKVILQHSKQLDENDKRYYNIEKIFVENTNGERFLLPTRRPGIAKVYARHVAEGGTPYDERGSHITSLVEEYTKMAGFVRAVRNGQFNESATNLINEGINHYNNLRETLSRMISQRGYNNYFESYTPVLNEEQIEESNINELFTKSTLDPRIENVLPILNKLNKNITEVKEANELEEWADKIVEGDASEPGRYYTSDDVENFVKQFIQSSYMIPNNDAFNRYELIKAIFRYIDANPQSVKGIDPTHLRDFPHQVATEIIHRLKLPIREGELVQLTPSDDELEGEFIGTDVGVAKPTVSNVKEKYVSRYGDEWETYLLADLLEFLRKKDYPLKLRAKKAHEMLNKIDPTVHADMPYGQFKEATDLKSIPESELDEINFNILKKKPSPEERAAKAYDAARMPSTKDKFKQAYTTMRKNMGMDDNAKTKELVGEEGVAEGSGGPSWPEVISALTQGYPDIDPTDALKPLMQKYRVSYNYFDKLAQQQGYKDVFDAYAEFEELPTTGPTMSKGVAEGYWQDAVKKAEASRKARKGKPFEKNPASHDKQGVYIGDKDLAGNPVPKRKDQGVAEGSTMSWIVYRQDTTLYPNGERDHETEVVKTFNNDQEAEDYANKLNAANRDYDVYYFVRGKQQGVAEDLDANQKRVGQLGPTEPVGKNEKNLRGKLVGAESIDPEIRRLKKLSGV